jgi:TrpR family trp operon transcriptional repressor
MNKSNLKKFTDIILEIRDRGLLEDFLKGILTNKELEEIPVRLEIVRRLLKGEPQHNIAKDLGVGVATVSRGAKELKLGRFKIFSNRD